MTSSPNPVARFTEIALRSGLVDEKQLARAIELAGQNDDGLVAQTLVDSGVITNYQAEQLRAGRTKLHLGPYLITDFIGQGGMGRVFKAVHRVMGRECAVKVLPLEKLTDESRDSFIREIRVQAGLDSPYVVRAYDAGRDGNVHYLVTEYVPGTDLRKLIRQRTLRGGQPLLMETAASIISQAAMGLQYAHDFGLIHRDIKPGNILVTPEGVAKLSDIGLATWSMGLAGDPRAGKIVGTADYLSPEQVREPLSISPTSDIYSLGCTLYYAVTGKVPFPGGDSRSKCRRHCEETPLHPRNLAPELSEDFVDVIADMMEKEPTRRIAVAAEVVQRLEPWASRNESAPSLPTHEYRPNWTPAPPPLEPSLLRESADDTPELGNESASGGLSRSGQQSSERSVLPSIPGTGYANDWMDDRSQLSQLQLTPRPSHALAIAVALAIAIPISLLVGAVIGFIVRGNL